MYDFCGYNTLKKFLDCGGMIHCNDLGERLEAINYIKDNTPYDLGFNYEEYADRTDLMYITIVYDAIHMHGYARSSPVIEYCDLVAAPIPCDFDGCPPSFEDLFSLFSA